MEAQPLTLRLVAGRYAVVRLAPQAELPAWAVGGELLSITRTPEELSIVCAQAAVPEGVIAQGSFCCLKVQGPLDFALTGILASLTLPLAQAGISIFVISTYDTDYLLLPETSLEDAALVLAQAGHTLLR